MPKRRAEPAIESLQRRSKQPWFEVDRHLLAGLGWDGASPLAADEDEFYRWLTEPELWVQHAGLMRELDARVRRRLVRTLTLTLTLTLTRTLTPTLTRTLPLNPNPNPNQAAA